MSEHRCESNPFPEPRLMKEYTEIFLYEIILDKDSLTELQSGFSKPFIIMLCTYFSLITFLDLKSSLSEINVATYAFFSSVLAWSIFLSPFTFNLCVSLHLMLIFYRQHIVGSLFLILYRTCVHLFIYCMWDLSSLTKDQTWASCMGSMKS